MNLVKRTLFILLILMVQLNAGISLPSSKVTGTLASQKACAASEKEAVIKADALLEERLGIHSSRLYSKNVYIRHPQNKQGEFCVEGVVTQEGFNIYSAELEEAYESIMGEIEDLNDGISFTQKQREVGRLYSDISRYNMKITAAEKLASLPIERIEETKASLNKMINAIPVVTFTVNGCKGNYMTGCRLVFVSSYEDDSSSVVYRWSFGDGGHSSRTNPIHYYRKPGTYKVTLRITDGGQKQAEVTQEIDVAAKPQPKIKHAPNASFSTTKKVYESGEAIEFIDLSTSEDSEIVSYMWAFGDGGRSTHHHPKYYYQKPGTYKIHLEITNSDGLKSSTTETLNVVHPAIRFAIDGQKMNRVVRKFGEPDESVVNDGVLTQAYRYGSDWLLVKQNQVECRIKGSVYKTNLMGNPKNCHWYEKNAPSAIYLLNE